MERQAAGDGDQTPSTFLNFCGICHKPFTKEYSFSRHVSYCRRAKAKRKNRPRACRSCNISKTKCSLARPQCSRCQAQGLECAYDKPAHRSFAGYSSIEIGQKSSLITDLPLGESLVIGTLSPKFTTGLYDGDLGSSYIDQNPDAWVTDGLGSQPTISSVDTNLWESGIDFNPSPANPGDVIEPGASTELYQAYQDSSSSKFVASLLTHAISAFPQMMLRRQTFPPFIHAYWHMPSLPETLASCMSIAQIFATRTPETRPFLWRMIGAEVQRLQDEAEIATVHSIQNSLQAIVQFLIMAIADQDAGSLSWAPNLIQTFQILCNRSRNLLGGNCFTYTEENFPSTTWEDWVFAETRRRIICLWFFISLIISVQTGSNPGIRAYPLNLLPLVSNKTLWEARTLTEWEAEKALYDASYPMTTIEELVEAKKRSNEPFYRRRLEVWDAGVDKMGILINIATELL